MAARELDIRAVVDELATHKGKHVTVQVHASATEPAPRAMLSGAAGALSMDDETGGDEDRGLIFLAIGAEPGAEPGRCQGIYFDQQHFASAEAAGALTIHLNDGTFFVIEERA